MNSIFTSNGDALDGGMFDCQLDVLVINIGLRGYCFFAITFHHYHYVCAN